MQTKYFLILEKLLAIIVPSFKHKQSNSINHDISNNHDIIAHDSC